MTTYGWSVHSNVYHALEAVPERRGWQRTTCGKERWVDRWSDVAPLLRACDICGSRLARTEYERLSVEARVTRHLMPVISRRATTPRPVRARKTYAERYAGRSA